MAENNIRDYSSIYSIKEFALKEIAPKYFDMDNVNLLNIGLIGYVTDLAANMTEDTFNSISTYIREIFPNLARIPETLYNYAARLQIDNLFATPAQINLALFVNEKDIINLGEKKESMYEFVLDSDLVVDIEGIQFMPDYNIIITAKPYHGNYIFTAQYDMTYKNTLSSVVNPYIKTTRIVMNGSNYLGLFIKVRQVNKFEQVENIISNDKINLPTISFEFNDQIANFEVFYKPLGSDNYVQLKKRMHGSVPLKEPFCFYRIKDENKVEISFSARENYFQPEFNSEILINYYTTLGSKGNFPEYKGTNITVIPKSEVYLYNNNIILFAVPQGESHDGRDKLSLEELREKIIELTSTSGAYNIENDLQLYFSNYKFKDNNDVLFVKKRDDVLERIFSAFSLFKDTNNDYYPTNTLNMDLYKEDFDLEYEQSNRYILKAGHLFKYDPNYIDKVVCIRGKKLTDDLTTINEPFIFTNPFLMTVSKSPSVIGYYLNSLDTKHSLEYTYVNIDSPVQFICNTLQIKRNALMGEDEYTLTINIAPISPLESPLVDNEGRDLGKLKVILTIEDNGLEICYKEFSLKSYDSSSEIYTFETKIKTDDYMTLTQKMRVYEVKNRNTGEVEISLIPMYDAKVNIHTLYKYDNMVLEHKFANLSDYVNYTLTNTYTTSQASFIIPLHIMRSRVKYMPYVYPDPETQEPVNDFYMYISSIPLVGASKMKDSNAFSHFLNLIFNQYNYLMEIVDKITNNYGIDLKFYNTYGRSKNFIVGEEGELLDKTNITIHFKVAPTVGAIEEELVRDLKIFIKDYIEGINNKGYNSIYISNLIQAIENQFPEVKYLKFVRINNYDSSVQVIENKKSDLNLLTKEERRDYVPEYLTIGIDDVIIDIIRN
jgi:hypothetical protein